MQRIPKIWDRKILRKINGPIKDQNVWRVRTNDELQVTNRKPNTVTTKKARRLEWAAHVVRMSDDVTKSTYGGNGRKKKNREIKNKVEGRTPDRRSA